MSTTLNKDAYEQLIKQNLDFLNKHCPDTLELKHIKLVLIKSIDFLYSKTEELKFDKETSEALYLIFCGLSRSCYENAEVCDEYKPNMKKAYEKVLDYGNENCYEKN